VWKKKKPTMDSKGGKGLSKKGIKNYRKRGLRRTALVGDVWECTFVKNSIHYNIGREQEMASRNRNREILKNREDPHKRNPTGTRKIWGEEVSNHAL